MLQYSRGGVIGTFGGFGTIRDLRFGSLLKYTRTNHRKAAISQPPMSSPISFRAVSPLATMLFTASRKEHVNGILMESPFPHQYFSFLSEYRDAAALPQ